MKKIVLAILLVSILCTVTSYAQGNYSFKKETYEFALKGNERLLLDKYTPKIEAENMPCIIFMFGGAFARGARDVEKYMPYFDFLTHHGYAVVSIDYRLGLKELASNTNFGEEQLVGMLVNSINMAVEDLFDATVFILDNAAAWNIDPENLILNGSSAGAVSVLQAEYDICNTNPLSFKLPAGFRYKGVIAFAGAIFTADNGVKWDRQPCPIMMLHGDADLQVPYNELRIEHTGLYGAKYISDSLDPLGYPYYFHSFANYGHEIASSPMQFNKYEIMHFLENFVHDGQQQQIRVYEEMIGKPDVKKDFDIFDYVNGNFPQ